MALHRLNPQLTGLLSLRLSKMRWRLSSRLQSLNSVAYCMNAMVMNLNNPPAQGGAACDVVIVGAGPYGLSIAAHLQARKIRFRIFGRPMDTWRSNMPAGMSLKSDGFASNLCDPDGVFTLKQYCADNKIEYSDTAVPVPLEIFCAYGMAFADRFVPELEENNVEQIDPTDDGFLLRLDDGQLVSARRVVLAVGITHFPHIPKNLADVPEQFLSHSAAHHDLTPFRGKNVAVVGGGASAINLAYLLKDAEANVELILRQPNLIFSGKPQETQRTLAQKLRHPPSGLGPGWRSRFCTDAPLLFHRLPQAFGRRLCVDTSAPPVPGIPKTGCWDGYRSTPVVSCSRRRSRMEKSDYTLKQKTERIARS